MKIVGLPEDDSVSTNSLACVVLPVRSQPSMTMSVPRLLSLVLSVVPVVVVVLGFTVWTILVSLGVPILGKKKKVQNLK